MCILNISIVSICSFYWTEHIYCLKEIWHESVFIFVHHQPVMIAYLLANTSISLHWCYTELYLFTAISCCIRFNTQEIELMWYKSKLHQGHITLTASGPTAWLPGTTLWCRIHESFLKSKNAMTLHRLLWWPRSSQHARNGEQVTNLYANTLVNIKSLSTN